MIRLGFGEMYDNISYGKAQNVLWSRSSLSVYFLVENIRVTSLESVNFE
mgnify:CR=1 FL=1|jgi:hypothetical protein